MTFFFTPRMESGSAAVTPPTVNNGWYPRDSHGGVIRKKIEEKELHRVRVLRRRLGELRGEEIQVQTLPQEIQIDLQKMELETRQKMEASFRDTLAREFKDILSMLETVQLDNQKMIKLWEQTQEEELTLFIMMT